MLKPYDYVISLGEKCFVAQTLENLGARAFSGPFDWLEIFYNGTGGGVLERMDMIINKFQHFFDKDDFTSVYEGDWRLFANTRTNLSFRHEFSQTDEFDQKFKDVATKYARRCNRMLDILHSGARILLVYASSCFPVPDRKLVAEKISALNTAFGTNKIDLMCVDSDKRLKRKNRIKYDTSNPHLIWVSGVDLYKPIADHAPMYFINTLGHIISSHAKFQDRRQNIVSLTSFPARIHNLHNVIKTLLNQSVTPDKIVLYLAMDEFPGRVVPDALAKLQGDIFEIRFTDKNYRSFNKLVHALRDFPNANIITVDDDISYPTDLIAQLLDAHKKHPHDICAHRIRRICIKHGAVQSYHKWYRSEQRGIFHKYIPRGYKNLMCGVGGVLYPPHALHPDVLDADKFIQLCRHQDDVWFWAMAVHNDRKISVTRHGYNVEQRTMRNVQDVGLWNTVNGTENSPNNVAIDNVIRQYPKEKKKIGLR